MTEDHTSQQQLAERERWQILIQLEKWVETPMVVLSFIWLLLVVVELIWSTSGLFGVVGTAIWIVLIGEFLLRLISWTSSVATRSRGHTYVRTRG